MLATLELTFIGAIKVSVVILLAYFLYHAMVKRMDGKPGSHYRLQMLLLAIALVALILIVVVLPIDKQLRGQLLSLIGILLSAVIALSSTTFVGNVMAGAMLRSIKNCRPGDYVFIGDYFGRISEMELMHVEIQTEDRDLVTLPNLFVVTNPMKVLRPSGTIISASLSLGYDVSKTDIETNLKLAAEKTGLENPFVHVRELGDFSVVYRVSGLLTDLKKLLSSQSALKANVLDQLHGAGVEIVSPTFMNQRQYRTDETFMPARSHEKVETAEEAAPEDEIFDKAVQAESIHELRERVDSLVEKTKALEKEKKGAVEEAHKVKLDAQIADMNTQVERWQQAIQSREVQLNKEA